MNKFSYFGAFKDILQFFHNSCFLHPLYPNTPHISIFAYRGFSNFIFKNCRDGYILKACGIIFRVNCSKLKQKLLSGQSAPLFGKSTCAYMRGNRVHIIELVLLKSKLLLLFTQKNSIRLLRRR